MIFTEYAHVRVEVHNEPALSSVQVAHGFPRRLLGLLLRSSLPEGEGLIIPDCGAIHTFGMRFVIDVLFFTEDGTVMALYPETPSGHVLTPRLRAVNALEAAAGFIARYGINTGDKLILTAGSA